MRSFILFGLFVAVSHASSPAWVLHERRGSDEPAIRGRSRIEPDVLLPMRIGLQQNGEALKAAESWLMNVSDPDSSHYGRYWQQKDVITAFQPSEQTLRAVTKWLAGYGIFNFTHSDNKLWFAFDLSASKAEEMLRAEFFEYQVSDSLVFEAACDEYYLPSGLKDHVDFVVPGVTSAGITGRTAKSRQALRDAVLSHRNARSGSNARPQAKRTFEDSSTDEKNLTCTAGISATCIRDLYDIPLANPDQPISPNNSMGIFEALHRTYNQDVLNLFYDRFTNVPTGTEPIFVSVDGHYAPHNFTHADEYIWEGLEPQSDIEMALPIVYPQNVTMWTMSSDFKLSPDGKATHHNYLNRFLDAIDGSYCTYEQRVNSADGGKPKCGVFQPTNVISYSWATTELIPAGTFWKRRQCNEYLKLGLQGVSFFHCSRDEGVDNFPGVAHPNCTKAPTDLPSPNSGLLFQPAFPASCPWVTAVGATRLDEKLGGEEVAARISGGGFSILWERPSYQNAAIKEWQQTTNSTIPYYYNGDWQNSTTGRYNRNGRGLPDISAIGENIWLNDRYGFQRNGGTSFSTPIVAAIFTRINEERLRAGKPVVGFVNPAIYKNPQAFNDILVGYNGECGPKSGFLCQEGWDPVTGLGTPRYGELLEVFMGGG